MAIRGEAPLHAGSSLLPAKYTAFAEMLAYCTALVIGIMAFLSGAMTLGEAGVFSVILLFSLIALSWVRFDRGRHPCFLFLCVLTLFQAGRLILFSTGMLPDPFRIELFVYPGFDLSRQTNGLFLLSLCLSAICVYGVCRWKYHFVEVERPAWTSKALPYLYGVFYLAIPWEILQNYLLLRYAAAHEGYLTFYLDRAGLAASVPLLVHLPSLLAPPAFMAIFILEYRKLPLYIATMLYFAGFIVVLLSGSRAATFSMILVLWYIARLKSEKRPRIVSLAFVTLTLIVIGNLIGNLRLINDSSGAESLAISSFISTQGITMNVTQLAIANRGLFEPYAASYLLNEIKEAFIAQDQSSYQRGASLANDITVFLNPIAFGQGFGSGSSFLGEAYVAGGLSGVVAFSLLLGFLLDALYRSCHHPFGMFVAATILPGVLWMARSGFFEWVADFIRTGFFVAALAAGWLVYRMVCLALWGESRNRGFAH
jgi:oligosaccharide repeat unit polymerase